MSPLPQCLWPSNLARWWRTRWHSYLKGHMALGSCARLRSCDKSNHYVSTTTVRIATKCGRAVTYCEGLPSRNPPDHLITWFCEIAWQTKTYFNHQSVFSRMGTFATKIIMATRVSKMVTYFERLINMLHRQNLP